MDLVLTDAEGGDVAVTREFSLDMQWGEGACSDCDFELSGVPVRLYPGSRCYVDGTEYGGVVDSLEVTHDELGESVTYRGRTWHGVLAGKVLSPPAGSAHVTVGGDANAALRSLVALCPVGAPFAVAAGDSGLSLPSTRLPRYCTLYEAMRRACRAAGARLTIVADQSGVTLSASKAVDWGEVVEPGEMSFTATRAYRPVNHLVVLGKGELAARKVVHLYADAEGAVSQTQTLTGLDERAQTYVLASEEDANLVPKGTEKLRDLQAADKVEAEIASSYGVAVGDRVTLQVPSYGFGTSAEVTGLVAKGKRGTFAVTPQTGVPEVTEDVE